jgi:hypothetical protein
METNKTNLMTSRGEMDTLSTILEQLKQKHHYKEFTISAMGLVLLSGKLYKENEIKMTKTYRFEGDSDPAEEAIIYIIEADDGAVGYSIDAYGVYINHSDDAYGDL